MKSGDQVSISSSQEEDNDNEDNTETTTETKTLSITSLQRGSSSCSSGCTPNIIVKNRKTEEQRQNKSTNNNSDFQILTNFHQNNNNINSSSSYSPYKSLQRNIRNHAASTKKQYQPVQSYGVFFGYNKDNQLVAPVPCSYKIMQNNDKSTKTPDCESQFVPEMFPINSAVDFGLSTPENGGSVFTPKLERPRSLIFMSADNTPRKSKKQLCEELLKPDYLRSTGNTTTQCIEENNNYDTQQQEQQQQRQYKKVVETSGTTVSGSSSHHVSQYQQNPTRQQCDQLRALQLAYVEFKQLLRPWGKFFVKK